MSHFDNDFYYVCVIVEVMCMIILHEVTLVKQYLFSSYAVYLFYQRNSLSLQKTGARKLLYDLLYGEIEWVLSL